MTILAIRRKLDGHKIIVVIQRFVIVIPCHHVSHGLGTFRHVKGWQGRCSATFEESLLFIVI
jgi:hypothetical protein